MVDPDARVGGRGLAKLKKAGIETVVGVLETDCRALNETFIKHRSAGLPFITIKWLKPWTGGSPRRRQLALDKLPNLESWRISSAQNTTPSWWRRHCY